MSSTRGLGRGLAAILQGGDSTSDTTATSVLGRLVGSVAHGLAAPAPLAVNGYLHLPDDGDADLLLAAPRLADLEPNDVWQVFEAIHQAIDSDADTLGHVLLGVPALTVRTHGPASRGVHVLAGEHLDDATQAVLTRFCRLWSPVVHGFALTQRASEACQVSLDQADGIAHVELRIGHHTGFGSAASPRQAVAHATLAALNDPAKVTDLAIVSDDDHGCVVVTIVTADGATSLAAAPLADGELTAVAVAVQRASRALAYGT